MEGGEFEIRDVVLSQVTAVYLTFSTPNANTMDEKKKSSTS